MKSEVITRQQSDELYYILKFLEDENAKGSNLYDMCKSAKVEGFSPEATKSNLDLCIRVVKEVSSEEFASFILERNVPPIKLSNKEMEILNGGAPPWVWIARGCGVVIGNIVEATTGRSMQYHAGRIAGRIFG